MHKKIIYVAGWGRSGSTLLGNILNEIDGLFHTGELPYVWENGFEHNRLCACGSRFKDCPVWSEISDYVFQSFDNLDYQSIKRLRDSAPQNRHVGLHFLNLHSIDNHEYTNYLYILDRLYTGIFEITGCDILVDSSKIPSHAFLLSQLSSFDLTLIHLVRDPRGTANSWSKKIDRQDAQPDGTIQMEQYTPTIQSMKWLFWNILFEMMPHHTDVEYVRIRYEDFVTEPAKSIDHIGDATNMTNIQFPGRDRSIHLRGNHMAWGNPSRSKTGTIHLRLDEGWKSNLSRWDRTKVEFITWPLLLKYGYPLQ